MKIPSDLLAGYRRFRKERLADEERRYRALADGQNPKTMIIGCADSRVDPATIFSAAPGELFVIRNIAALVPPFEEKGTYHGTSAAVEFAVTSLKVENIVVIGHGLCGGITAALADAEQQHIGQFIKPWVDMISEVRDELLARTNPLQAEYRQFELEHLAIQQSLKNLSTFPFVREALESGALNLHGAWFSIMEAKLRWLDNATGEFEAIKLRDL